MRDDATEHATSAFDPLSSIELSGRRVLVRTTPEALARQLDRQANHGDGFAVLRTLVAGGALVILAAHQGPALESRQVGDMLLLGEALSDALGVEVLLPDACVGESADRVAQELREGRMALLPDLLPDDAQAGDEWARGLSRLADAYVFDALESADQPWASLVALPPLVRDCAVSDETLTALESFSRLARGTSASRTAIVGAPDAESGLRMLEPLLSRFGRIVVSGGLGRSLLSASGMRSSGAASPTLAPARSLLTRARRAGSQLLLPSDFKPGTAPADGVAAEATEAPRPASEHAAQSTTTLGAQSLEQLQAALDKSASVLWWGSPGDPDTLAAMAKRIMQCQAPVAVLGPTLGRALRRGAAGSESVALAASACESEVVGLALLQRQPLAGLAGITQATLRQRSARLEQER